MQKTLKIGVNDICPCGSLKKYKKCCKNEDVQIKLEKNIELDQLSMTGHPVSDDLIQKFIDMFKNKNIEAIDVTNFLTSHTFARIQLNNKTRHVLVISKKHEENKFVFDTLKCDPSDDFLVMFKNEYRAFNSSSEFEQGCKVVSNMIDPTPAPRVKSTYFNPWKYV